jgi:hypothetical protein
VRERIAGYIVVGGPSKLGLNNGAWVQEVRNILNKQLQTADRGWPSSLGWGTNNPHRKKNVYVANYLQLPRKCTGFRSESQKERNHLEDQGVDGRMRSE